jgi:phosphonate transport system ATP-binding protein
MIADAPPVLRIENIVKTFGPGRFALNNVSIAVEQGEMVALIGASGSDKSTLLRLIPGFLPAESGTIEVFGRMVQTGGKISTNVRELRAAIGFVFQQFNLVNRLSVLTNVLAGLLFRMPLWRSMFGWFNAEERRAAFSEMTAVGILEQAYQRAGDLSGGQQQRAALARTLVQKARIILADEPIASLDPESSRNVMEILARMNRERGLTVLVSLHQIDFAIRYCPRAIALHQGRVVYDGPSCNLDEATLRSIYGSAAEQLLHAPHNEMSTRVDLPRVVVAPMAA